MPPDPAALLAHSGWVRALARSLVADPSAADDIEQEAWRKALESPPKHSGNLRAWLSSVVRSVAIQRSRGESRVHGRHARLQSAADASSGVGPRQAPPETPQQVSERLETFQKLAGAVSDLEEPFGSAIYLRFVEELSVKEVARRQGVPVPTAQTRIQRGLELLRNRLHGSLGSDWRARCMVFAMPAPLASASLWTAFIAMTATPKFLAAAAAVVLAIPLYSVLTAEVEPEQTNPSTEAVVEAPLATAQDASPVLNEELSTPEREAVTEQPTLAEPDPAAIRVVVRDAETLEEISGAEVLYFDRASDKDDAWGRDQFDRYTDTETLLEKYGDFYRADENGRTTLPARKSYAYIAARANGEYAMTYLFDDVETSGQTEVELLLRPAVHVEVKVIDAAGQPVADQRVEYQEWWKRDFGQYLGQAMTNDEGVAVFRNMQQRFAETRSDHEYRMSVPIPGAVASEAFEPKAPPTQALVLRLPETCAMHVSVVDEEGNPIANGKPVFMQGWSEDEQLTDVYRTNAKRGGMMTWIRDGKAVFPRVALGTRVLTWIQLPGQRQAARADQVTPLAADAIGEIVLLGPPEPTTLTMMVVDEAGQALPEVTLNLQQVALALGVEVDAIRTRAGSNASGKLAILQDRMLEDNGAALEGARMKLFASHVAASTVRWGIQEWDIVTAPGESELPDLVMGAELIAGGRVVTSDGQALASAELNLRLPPFWPGGEDSIWLQLKADEQGRFEIRGEGLELGSEFQVWVSGPRTKAGHSSADGGAWAVLVVGDDDQHLVYADSASIKGRLLLPKNAPAESLTLSLEVVDASGEKHFEYIDIDRSNGRFERANLGEGTGTLILATSPGIEIARSAPFELSAQGTEIPEEWKELDLRDSLFVHQLSVVDVDGDPVSSFNFMIEEAQRGAGGREEVSLALPYAQFTVTVDADGFRPSEPQLVSGDATVVLSRGLDVEFVLADGVDMPEGQFRLYLRKIGGPGQPTAGDRRWEQVAAGEGRWKGALPYAGRYMLGIAHIQPGEFASEIRSEVMLKEGLPIINIDVEDAEGVQRIVIPVTQAALRAAADAGRDG